MPVGTMSVRVPVEVYERLMEYAAKYQVPIGQAWFAMVNEYEQKIKALEEEIRTLRKEIDDARAAFGKKPG